MTVPSSYFLPENVDPLRLQANTSSDYRAVVCVFLFGANDSHNMILPRAGSPNRTHYDSERGTLAITAGTELAMTSQWGFHPQMTKMKELWDAGKLGALMNVGNLKQPTTRAQFLAKSVKLPDQLFSHNSQQEQWMGLPGFFTNVVKNGWMGRAGELMGGVYNESATIGPAFSITGKRTQMQGWDATSNELNTSGAQTIGGGDARSVAAFAATLSASRTRSEFGNVQQRLMAARVKRAIDNQTSISTLLQTLGATPDGRFTTAVSAIAGVAGTQTSSNQSLANQLRVVARIIASRANFSHRRDVFFVQLGGWDDHDNLNTLFGPRVHALSESLYAFYKALEDIGMHNNVVTATESEFGRALKQNAGGSDHGWGGHALIMGGSVNGGVIYGTPPDLAPLNSQDAGQGRMIPTTSVEQYASTLLNWWGIPLAQMPLVLENCERFSPVSIPGMLSEPANTLGVTPAYSVTAMNKTVPASVTHTVGTARAAATFFDENGNMRVCEQNLVANSGAYGATVGLVTGTNTGLPTGWSRSNFSSNGVNHSVVAHGTLPNGARYVDVRVHGTNNHPTQIGYVHLYVGSSPTASLVDAAPGVAMSFSANAGIVGGSTAGFGASPTMIVAHFNNSTYVSETALGVDRIITPVFRPVLASGRCPGGSANKVVTYVSMYVTPGNTVDMTIRISEPMLKYEMDTNLYDSVRGKYIESPVSGVHLPPRYDYDPVTKNLLGALFEVASSNVIQNSIFNSASRGTPGTLPTGASASAPTGLTYSIVEVQMRDSGIPYLEIRVHGTATAAGNFDFNPHNVVYPVVAGANEDWSASLHFSIVGGSTANISNLFFDMLGRIAGAGAQSFPVLLLGATNAPLAQQHFATSGRMTNSSVDGINCVLRLTPVQNQPVDITFRIGAPQLEKRPHFTSYMPTGPSNTWGRPDEVYRVSGANFTPWFNPAEGTMVVKAAVGINAAAEQTQYPQFANFTDGTDSNRISVYGVAGRATGVDQTGKGGSSSRLATVSQGDVVVITPLIPYRVPGVRAHAYKLNDAQYSQKGVVGIVDDTYTVPTTMTMLTLAGSANGGSSGRLWFQSFEYYNTRLPNSSLALLTAS